MPIVNSPKLRRGLYWLRKAVVSVWLWVVIVALFEGGLVLSTVCLWEWLRGENGSPSDIIRNVALIGAAPIAIMLAVWRSIVGSKQADTAQRSLLNERYQKGAEMLGHAVLSIRLGGIYALGSLARDYPSSYHIQIMELFAAFVSNPVSDPSILEKFDDPDIQEKSPPALRADVQTILTIIGKRTKEQLAEETRAPFRLDLSGSYLVNLVLSQPILANTLLRSANLSHALIMGDAQNADLRSVSFESAQLRHARFALVDLSDCRFANADLHDIALFHVVLSGTDFVGSRFGPGPARGLTQDQLSAASALLTKPPRLEGVLDAETGEPLVWKGT